MKKTYTWDGKKVSRTTYFRMKRKPLAKGSSKAVAVATPASTLVPEVDYKAKMPAPEMPGEELVRDFMTMVGGCRTDNLNMDTPVLIPPRTFKAIITALRSLGY